MRVLVCGSRTFSDRTIVWAALGGLDTKDSITVIHGNANGADVLGGEWACRPNRIPAATVEAYPADWTKHGKAAGPIRNQQMLVEGRPDIVLAFVDKPLAASRGTADMVRRAKRDGIPTYVIEKL